MLLPSFYDNLYKPVRLPVGAPAPETVIGSSDPNDVIVSPHRPRAGIGSDNTKPGDLWWSIWDGRLFIYYDDGDTSQWVVTQPLGTVPLSDLSEDRYSLASDDALVTALENPPDQTLVPGGPNVITIATTAPDKRSDGSPNKMGDLWWTPETGTLFLWYTDGLQTYQETGVYAENTAQWVITDPAGIAPLGHNNESYALDEVYPEDTAFSTSFSIYSNEITSMISDVAPTQKPDGSPIEFGNLFWSPRSGKMYVYWRDESGDEQWTVCNPSGAITSQYAMNKIPGGEVGPGPDTVSYTHLTLPTKA